MQTYSAASELDQWADDGGIQPGVLPLQDTLFTSNDLKYRVFESLGASIAAMWDNLPRDIQRNIFYHAVNKQTNKNKTLNRQIAEYPPNYKGT